MQFSGVTALNCCLINLSAAVSFPSICWAFMAVPMRNSFLKTSFNEGVCAMAVPANNTAETEKISGSFFIIAYRFWIYKLFPEGRGNSVLIHQNQEPIFVE